MNYYTINYPETPQPELSLDQQDMAKSLSVTIASDQTAIPISGTIVASNPSVGPNNSGSPSNSTLLGGDDGGTLRALSATYTGGVGYLRVDTSGFISPSASTSSNQTNGNQKTQVVDGSGNVITSTSVSSKQALDVDVASLEGFDDSANSSTTLLSGGATFTGVWIDITNYSAISLGVYSDVASATDGLIAQYSYDGVTVHHQHTYTYIGGSVGIGYNLTAEFKYYRIKYTNGASAQGSFALQSILKPTALSPSMYKITNTLTDNSQAIVTRSVITGVTTGGGGGYVNVKVNPSGALVTDSTVSGTVAATQSGTWNITNISGTVSLPTGAATSANQTTANSSLSSIDGKLTSVTVGTLPSIPAGSNNIGSITDITGTISLPTLAATSTKQSDGSQKTQIVDGSGNVIAATSNALNVNIQNTSIQAKAAVNLNGSGSGAGATVSTVITLTAPSNAVGFILMNMDTSTANIRYAIGRTASATLGQQLQPGRDTGFIPCGANISLCAESGTQTYDVQWVSQ